MEPQYHNRHHHQRTYGGGGGGSGGGGGGSLPMETTRQPSTQLQSQHSDNDRTSNELRALDCNLTSLCDHIQLEGFNNGSFSDVIVQAMGSTYHLHRLILSRSSYFRFLLIPSLVGFFCYTFSFTCFTNSYFTRRFDVFAVFFCFWHHLALLSQ